MCARARLHTISSLPRARPAPPLPGVDIAGESGRGTYREEPSRDISIATRLRVRDKPDPHSAACRSHPSPTPGMVPPSPSPVPRQPRGGEKLRNLLRMRGRDAKGVKCRRGTTATSRPMIKTRRITAASPISPCLPSFLPSFLALRR